MVYGISECSTYYKQNCLFYCQNFVLRCVELTRPCWLLVFTGWRLQIILKKWSITCCRFITCRFDISYCKRGRSRLCIMNDSVDKTRKHEAAGLRRQFFDNQRYLWHASWNFLWTNWMFPTAARGWGLLLQFIWISEYPLYFIWTYMYQWWVQTIHCY